MISAVITYADGRVSIHDSPAKLVDMKFSPGFYSAITDNGNIKIRTESLKELHIPYKTPENKIVMDSVIGFFNEGVMKKVNELGFVHKLGILMYGRQGTAKTSLMNFIANQLVKEKDAVTFICNNGNQLGTAITIANSIREIQNNPIVFVADEMDHNIPEKRKVI